MPPTDNHRTDHNRPLRICLISYRSNPHSGGQGVYLKNLGRALTDGGHHVDVVSGPPRIHLGDGIRLYRPSCLDLYDPADPFRMPRLKELLSPINLMEWIGVSTMGFPEPFTFGLRAYRILKNRLHRYDIVHDNQSLSYGIWAIATRKATIATIHHPITVDRMLAVRSAGSFWQKVKQLRWHSFLRMQKLVARNLPYLITVSEAARRDIAAAYGVAAQQIHVVHNGIDTRLFRPLPGVKRRTDRIIVTNSADTPLKGLRYLLQAVSDVARKRNLRLVVVGQPKKDGDIPSLIQELGIGGRVEFTGRIRQEDLVHHYAEAAAAVVPSVYEGFGLPAGEAMACGVPVISTRGGALPEVVGDAGLLVPPADAAALATAIETLLRHPDYAARLAQKGLNRVQRHFTWQRAAEKTTAVYRRAMHADC